MAHGAIATNRGGAGSPWRICPRSAQVGEICTVRGGDKAFGDVVIAAVDPLEIVETDIGGEDSMMLTVDEPEAGTDGDIYFHGFVGVVQADAGILDDQKGPVQFGPATILVTCTTGTSVVAGQGFVVDYETNNGRLFVPAGTGITGGGKVVAKAARAYSGLSAGANLIWCHFDGIYGFGQYNTIA